MLFLLPRKQKFRFVLPIVGLGLFLCLFMLVSTGQSQANPTVWVALEEPGVVDDEVTLTVGTSDVVGLYGAEFILNFDSDQLQVVDANPEQAEIQILPGDCAKDSQIHLVENQAGIIRYISSQLSSSPTTGECVIAQIPFQLKSSTDTTLDLEVEELILVGASGEIATGVAPATVSLPLSSSERVTLKSSSEPSLPDGAPSTSLNLAVSHIEVSQAIQRPDNSVPMVAERPAVARVYIEVQNGAEEVAGVSAQLHAARDGKELADSPISPFNANFTAPLSPDANQLNHSLNFQLPTTWLTAGSLTLWAEANPKESVAEADYNDNRSDDLSLDFMPVAPLEVVLIPIAYMKNGDEQELRQPSLNGSNYLGLGMLPHTYPQANLNVKLHSEYTFKGDLATAEGWFQLLQEIAQLRLLEQPDGSFAGNANTMPKYYGVAPLRDVYYGGIAYQPGAAALGIVEQFDAAAQQMGYNLDLRSVGECSNPHNPDPTYPYTDGYIENVGLDVYNRRLKAGHENRDVMSNCWPKWISDYHYEMLRQSMSNAHQQKQLERGLHTWQELFSVYNRLMSVFFDLEIPDNTSLATPEAQNALLISGRISSDGSSSSAKLNHVLPTSSTKIVTAPGAGEYRLELRDNSDKVQFSYAFDPAQIAQVGEEAPPADFGFAVPHVDQLGSVQVWKGDKLLTTLEASPKPELSASFKEHAEEPDLLVVSWETSPSAEVILRYSADDGQSWQVLALGLTEESVELSKSQLAGSANGLLEVIASNPTQSASLYLELGEIENKAPKVDILAEDSKDGLIILSPNHPIVLSGVATDFEDGYISPQNLTWNISPDVVGETTGHTFIIPEGLPAGEYTVTLTTTDNDGNVGSAEVVLSVSAP